MARLLLQRICRKKPRLGLLGRWTREEPPHATFANLPRWRPGCECVCNGYADEAAAVRIRLCDFIIHRVGGMSTACMMDFHDFCTVY